MVWRLDRRGHAPIPIGAGDTLLGSSERCDVRLPGAEPRHAMLRVVAGRLFLESIDDAPLRINGQPQGKAFLSEGDRIQWTSGSEELVLCKADAPIAEIPRPEPSIANDPPVKVATRSHGQNWMTAAIGVLTLMLLFGAWFVFGPKSNGTNESSSTASPKKVEPDQSTKPSVSPDPAQAIAYQPTTPTQISAQTPVATSSVTPPDPPPTISKPAEKLIPAPVADDPAAPMDDLFPVGSVWNNKQLNASLKVTKRQGETFRAKFVRENNVEFNVMGTIKDGQVHWSADDVEVVRGESGGEHTGTFGKGERADRIDFEWDTGEVFGKFTLRRQRD